MAEAPMKTSITRLPEDFCWPSGSKVAVLFSVAPTRTSRTARSPEWGRWQPPGYLDLNALSPARYGAGCRGESLNGLDRQRGR